MDIFTSISLNYLPKARILANSVKRFHPDWKFHLLISDRFDEKVHQEVVINFSKEPFDQIHWVSDLKINNIFGWIFKHSIVEICTAVKGPFLQQLIREGAEKVIYLDPDIVVFNSLSDLDKLLDNHAILLTPHLLQFSDDHQSILDNEIMSTLRHGVFNLGFFGVNASKYDGRKFAQWWSDRLTDYCYADFDNGLFTDQKWCDLVPCFFEDYYIIRDPGYNIASWNINYRHLTFSTDGQILVNDQYPLRFYHFTGYDSGAGTIMTERYSQDNHVVSEIWEWYGREIKKMGQVRLGKFKYFFNYFDNGVEIPDRARRLYRQRKDLQEAFPNPFITTNPLNFCFWWNINHKE
jgi:lipopolysaccharide biosynthesis glycosyltransferase